MVWIYLADTEVSRSHSENWLDLSPTVRSSDTLSQSYFQECQRDFYQELQSGTMSKPLQEGTCQPKLTSSTGASRARISVLQEMERAWRESEAGFSTKCVDWSKKSTQDSSSWKTSQPLELADFEKSSENLQIWGMAVDGLVYLPKKLEPHILEKGGSSWPTPNTLDSMAVRPWKALERQFNMARKGRTKPANLREAIHKECYPPIKPYDHKTLGKLNPTWVEWLMGVPSGWTELKPWAMELFQPKSKKRSRD